MSDHERVVGQTRDTGFQIGVRRSLPLSVAAAWQLVTAPAGVRIWLGDAPDLLLEVGATYRLPDGTSGVVRVFQPGSHLRLTWHPPDWPRASTIQLRVLAGSVGSSIAFHHEWLPGPAERRARRAHYTAALDALTRLAEGTPVV